MSTMKGLSIGITAVLIILTMQGVMAASVISFEKSITPNPYATDDLISNAGTVNIPAGFGIITTKEIIQPYWDPGHHDLPVRIEIMPVDIRYIDLDLIGTDYSQFGNDISGPSFSNGVPLTIVRKYFINLTATTPYNILLYNSLDKGDTIQDYTLEFSAEYEPISVNRTGQETGSPLGMFNTNLGPLNFTQYSEKPYSQTLILQGNFTDGKQSMGALHGPVWFGQWRQNQTPVQESLLKNHAGNFLVIFNENWSSFSGSIGYQTSCTDGGSFSGEKEGT